MALPEDDLSSEPVASALLSPDNVERLSLLEDFERGGVALNDPTQGLDVRDWRAYTDGESVWVVPTPAMGVAPALQFTGTDITEVALAFDQNMQPTIAYVEGGVLKLWWYDTVANEMTVTPFADAVGPMLTMDDKRTIASASNDVILAYVRAGNAYYRLQRDRYGVEYLLGDTFGAARITQLGMGVNGRLQFKMLSVPRGGFADLRTDSLYVLSGQQILGLGMGDVAEATWRSRTYVLDGHPAPAWARVEGDYPIQLRVYGDGELAYTSPVITSPGPIRLPARRWRDWALELVGSTRVVQVAIANSREEL